MNLYVDDFDRISNISDSEKIKSIFLRPRGHWICDHKKNLSSSLRRFMNRCADKIPILVLYNAPNRDFGGYSAGGCKTHEQYLEFICDVVYGLNTKEALIILEPDLMPNAFSRSQHEFDDAILLINDSLKILKNTNCKIYIDIGHPYWLKYDDAINILFNISNDYHGFSLNVSNFVPTSECIAYGQIISQQIGKPFVIDTSRNGNLTYDITTVFNPPNRRIGPAPTMSTGLKNVDGLLWIKVPGESDGRSNGFPNAGRFSKKYAEELLRT